MDWTVDMEVKLLHAMISHKPVGPDKHFQMIYIASKLNSMTKDCNISVKDIWANLSKLYRMDALDETEPSPFPNKQREFELPSDEFNSYLNLEFPRVNFGDQKVMPMPKPLDDSISNTDTPRGRKRSRRSTLDSGPNSRSQSPSGSVETHSQSVTPGRRSKRH